MEHFSWAIRNSDGTWSSFCPSCSYFAGPFQYETMAVQQVERHGKTFGEQAADPKRRPFRAWITRTVRAGS